MWLKWLFDMVVASIGLAFAHSIYFTNFATVVKFTVVKF